jgi:hypothetical protein
MPIDAQRLRTEGVYEAGNPLGSIFDDMRQIEVVLQETEVMRRKLRRFAGLAVLVFLAFAIAAGVMGSAAMGFLAFAAFVFGLILFIYSFVYGRSMHKHHARFELMKALFQLLQRDADRRATFRVKLALKEQPKLLREEPFPQRKNGKQKFFEEEYLSVEGELLDGTAIHESVTELTRKRTYTNPRGKTKTKSRKRYLVTLRLDYPAEVYGDARPAQEALHEEMRVPPSATVRDLRVNEKAIAAKVVVESDQEIGQACGMVSVGAYRILNLARRVAAGGAK